MNNKIAKYTINSYEQTNSINDNVILMPQLVRFFGDVTINDMSNDTCLPRTTIIEILQSIYKKLSFEDLTRHGIVLSDEINALYTIGNIHYLYKMMCEVGYDEDIDTWDDWASEFIRESINEYLKYYEWYVRHCFRDWSDMYDDMKNRLKILEYLLLTIVWVV